MRRIALAITFVAGLIASAFAQKAEIEAVNAEWIEFFNKGDFAGIASLYADDATAFPPGSGMVKGRAAIAAMWKSMAEQVGDPKLTRASQQSGIAGCARAASGHAATPPMADMHSRRVMLSMAAFLFRPPCAR